MKSRMLGLLIINESWSAYQKMMGLATSKLSKKLPSEEPYCYEEASIDPKRRYH